MITYDVSVQYYDGTTHRLRDVLAASVKDNILTIEKAQDKFTFVVLDKVKFWTREEEVVKK